MFSIYGPEEVFGTSNLRPIDPDKLLELGYGTEFIQGHQHLGTLPTLRELYQLGVNRGISGLEFGLPDFIDRLTVVPGEQKNLEEYLIRAYHLAEMIQSGPSNVKRSVTAGLSHAFERTGKTFLGSDFGQLDIFETHGVEVRFNPMKRNEQDYVRGERIFKYRLSTIAEDAASALMRHNRTEERACLGVCFAKDQDLSAGLDPNERHRINLILAEKANQWIKAGYIRFIDIAGSEKAMPLGSPDELAHLKEWYDVASYGTQVGKTIHFGETTASSVDTFIKVIETIRPHRVGHGIQIAKHALETGDMRGIDAIKAQGITLELCMYSNLASGAVANVTEFVRIIEFLHGNEVKYMFGTDGMSAHAFNAEITSRRNGHFGVTQADEVVMLYLGGGSVEVIRAGLLQSTQSTFLNGNYLDAA